MIGLRKPATDVVRDLLGVQKEALISGDIERLGQIEAPLGKAFERLKSVPVDPLDLSQIKALASRNAALLKAAQSGLASARTQMSPRFSSDLSVYDSDGKSRTTGPGNSRLLARR